MQWSVVQDATRPFYSDGFFPPLASAVPTNISVPTNFQALHPPAATVYSFPAAAPVLNPGNTMTVDLPFPIDITPPAGGFQPEPEFPNLPPPAIRVHALTRGFLFFRPAANGRADSLVLRTSMFEFMRQTPAPAGNPPSPPVLPWFQRWIEADCIPREIIYENIDAQQLRGRLLATSVTPAGTAGLSFPAELTEATKPAYVDEIMAGQHFLIANPSAVIGQVALRTGSPDVRQLRMHVTYRGHTDASPHPMFPPELFYLVFGESSQQAAEHPLFVQMSQLAPGVQRTTLTTVMRPPMRTWRRAIWEAGVEHSLDILSPSQPWANVPALPSARLTNSHRRPRPGVTPAPPAAPVTYGSGNVLPHTYKCNVFTSDICIRAGFRVMIHPIAGGTPAAAGSWHYVDANSHANFGRQAIAAAPQNQNRRQPIQGQGADAAVIWGYALGGLIANGLTQADINAMMHDEGRCLIIAGVRPRTINNNSPTANCTNAQVTGGTGHIVLLEELTAALNMTTVVAGEQQAPGLVAGTQVIQGINALTAQASSTNGAVVGAAFAPQTQGVGGTGSGNHGYIRLQLLEVAPGKDRHSLQGLRDLNVFRNNRKLINTVSERARSVAMNPPTGAGPCCRDTWPTGGLVQGAC